MLKNYFKIAYRNIFKNSIFSFINILGLAIGVASTVLISYYVKFEKSYESIHENAENIFRLSLDLYNGNEFIINDVETYQTLGPEFKEKMPEVLDFVRLGRADIAPVRANDKTFYEARLYFADPSFFKIFSPKILKGDPYPLFNETYKATLSESTAIKYFGTIDVIGKTFQLDQQENLVEIVGVLEDSPQNTHLKFDVLISHATIPLYWGDWYLKYAWGGNNEYTYLIMEEDTDVDAFNAKLEAYSKSNEHLEDQIIISESIVDIHLYSNKSFEPEVNGSAQIVNFMLLVAIFIIIIAWVNYINLSTSRAINRAKEVGVRKAVGSARSQLISQFMIESFLINLIACGLAFTIVQISIPTFSSLTSQTLPDMLIAEPFIWVLMGSILLFGTALSGIYPAFILSSFKPSSVLKGKYANSTGAYLLRKGLVVFQFVTTVVLIAVSITVYYQMDHLRNLELGIEIDNTLVVRSPSIKLADSLYDQATRSFAKTLRSNALVSAVAMSEALPGIAMDELSTTSNVRRSTADENAGSYNYYLYDIDENFLPTMGIELAAGRNFMENEPRKRAIINEKAVETLGFESAEDAIGKLIQYGGGDYREEIVGVINNFHQRSPKEKHIPMIHRYSYVEDYITIKFSTLDSKEALTAVENVWNDLFPDAAFDYFFLNDTYNHQYRTDQVFSSVVALFSILSLIIALLGLFGLSTFTILQRTKEIGVRKVLGASTITLINLLSKDFLKLVVLAGIVSVPIAFYLITLWLDNYSSRVTVSWWLFVLPILVIVVVAFVSVIGQTLKSTLANPVDSLRNE